MTVDAAGDLQTRYARISDAFGARFVLNLDGPAGFSFSQNGVWGAALFYSTTL